MYITTEEIKVVEDEVKIEEVSSDSKFSKISFFTLLATLILTPLVFIPTVYAPIDMAKTVILTVGILLSSIFYVLHFFKNKTVNIPKSHLVSISFLIVFSIILSSLFSSNILKSLFGQGFELGIASTICIFFIGLFLTLAHTVKDKDRALYIYACIIFPFIILAIFHMARIFLGTGFMNLGILGSNVSTFLGKWNDMAVYSGVIVLLVLTSLKFLHLNSAFKFIIYILGLLSAFFLVVINFQSVWISLAVAVFGFVLFQYSKYISAGPGLKNISGQLPVFSSILFVLILVLIFSKGSILNPVSKSLKVEHAEIVLPWQLTMDVVLDTIKESPIFGAGPNNFGAYYLRHKPDVVNATQFWNLEFNSGSGLIPTFFVTQGLLGGLFWIAFIVLFIRSGFTALRRAGDDLSYFFISSSFFSALFLWITLMIYTPSHYIVFLTFIMTGLFLSSFASEKYFHDKKLSRGLLIVSLILLLLWSGFYVKKTLALGYFQAGISSLNSSNGVQMDKAEENFSRALFFHKDDIYYQALSETHILKITSLAGQIGSSASSNNEVVSEIVGLVEEAIGYTRKAIEIDPSNYYNYIAEARISETALSLKIPNAYENAKSAYTNALVLNPKNPALYLSLARIEASQDNLVEAQKYIGKALEIKQNYIEAIFLLSQIQVSQGRLGEAINSVKVASQINPTNPLIFFQLGLLHYNNRDYRSAVESFTQALNLNSGYANARYFLGISYTRLGNIADAIEQFEMLAETNPENEEVVLILSNLKSGLSPFAGSQPPIDNRPEQRSSLPISE